MGIQGLLPLLKSIHKPTHLRNFSGQTLGVDAYGWLHRGTVACAIDLAQGKPTRKHIDFALHRVRMLIHFGVKPYLVFDGDYLPSKAHTEKERAARRKESKKAGLDLLRMGRSSAAQLELQKAVDVTPAMARELIEELKRLDVPYVVAPYEADSQLAYLEKQGIIQGVVSEDSDLLVFGVQCLLTKLDQYGECVMINQKDFTACRDISLVGWTQKEFRMMAMLSGCDYLPGIDKMGLKTAYRLVRKHKTVDRVVRTVQFDGKMRVPPGYLEAFQKAERTFLHQWVFCPEAQSLLNLNALPANVEASSLPYIGKYVEPELAAGVACGDLDPNTKEPIPVPHQYRQPAMRTRVVQTPNEKPGKPITEFFKKRIPLAELDPNSFTPSPTQQRLLESQETRSWSASQIPTTRVFGASRSILPAPPSSAPQRSRRNVTDPFPSSARASPKRQRLCSDSSIAAAMGATESLEGTSSRFFAKPSHQPSPSLRRKSTRNTQTEFDLWSDDSALDAMAEATASVESSQSASIASPRKRKKLQIFADSQSTEADTSIGDMTQDSIVTTASTESQDAPQLDTPDTSFGSFDSPAHERSVFSKGIRTDFDSFRFGLSGSLLKSTPRRRPTSLFASTPLQLISSSEPPAKAVEPSTPQMREEEVAVSSSSPLVAQASSTIVDDNVDGEHPHDGKDKEAQSEILLVSDSSTLVVKGSEDMIVPESPEAVDSGGGGRLTKLSLGHFAFTG